MDREPGRFEILEHDLDGAVIDEAPDLPERREAVRRWSPI